MVCGDGVKSSLHTLLYPRAKVISSLFIISYDPGEERSMSICCGKIQDRPHSDIRQRTDKCLAWPEPASCTWNIHSLSWETNWIRAASLAVPGGLKCLPHLVVPPGVVIGAITVFYTFQKPQWFQQVLSYVLEK